MTQTGPAYRKLIEVALPLEAINKASAWERSQMSQAALACGETV